MTLGYVAARDPALRQALEDAVATWGLTPSPWDCWMAERGLHTFELRFERAQANARRIADHLAGLAGVEQVFYPGREDHPDRALARALLGTNPGNMVSFTVPGARAQANALMRALGGIAFAPTLGDVSTTISHPASSSHRGLTEAQRAALGITEAFFRLSVGIEDPALLLAEISAGVAAAPQPLRERVDMNSATDTPVGTPGAADGLSVGDRAASSRCGASADRPCRVDPGGHWPRRRAAAHRPAVGFPRGSNHAGHCSVAADRARGSGRTPARPPSLMAH